MKSSGKSLQYICFPYLYTYARQLWESRNWMHQVIARLLTQTNAADRTLDKLRRPEGCQGVGAELFTGIGLQSMHQILALYYPGAIEYGQHL